MGKWLNKYTILKPEHADDLEKESAMLEYGDGMPREEAEKTAYSKYLRSNRLDSAAHHLQGIKTAQAAGELSAAKKHGLLYGLHAKALGYEPVDQVPKEIVEHLKNNPSKVYRFRAHPGDAFAQEGADSDLTPKVEKNELIKDFVKTLKKNA